MLGPAGSANEANATAAAYVVTTFTKYRHSLPDAAGLPAGVVGADQVLVIEIDGNFRFAVSCYASCPTFTSVLMAYDLTRHVAFAPEYGSGSKSPPHLNWVSSFGMPIPLRVGIAPSPSM